MKQRYFKQKGTTTRQCSCCGGDLGQRYGIGRYCTTCHAKYMRENRPKYSELTSEQKQKAICRSLSRYYLSIGVIKKQPCKCGNPDSQMHHNDYNKPLLVKWLCRPCHLEYHKRIAA